MAANSVFNKYSRYVHGGTTEVNGQRLEWFERATFTVDPSDIAYVVEDRYAGRLDLLASVFYNEPRYWWVIAMVNNVLDPATEVVPGRVLYVPTRERLVTLLSGRQGGVDSKREAVPLVPPVVF